MHGPEESIMECVPLEECAGKRIKDHFGLGNDRKLRIAFLGGPGDVGGTFEHWINGRTDPRIPVIGYSSQFYTLVDKIGAEALVLAEPAMLPDRDHPSFRFAHTPRLRPAGRVSYRLDAARFARAVLRETAEFEPDVTVVGVDTPRSVVTNLARRGRVILSAHNTFWPMGKRSRSFRNRLKEAQIARGLKRISAAVCTSPECARQVAQLSGRRSGLFVETPQIPLGHKVSVRPRSDVRRLLYLGRIERNKGVLDLVAAFDRLAGAFPEIRLEIAGAGAAEGDLRAAIAAAEHGARIEYAGLLAGEGVHAALERADLLICPTRSSFSEGLALVVVEAAVHGVPAVLSSVVPAKELVVGGCVEFEADNTEAFYNALNELLAEPAAYQQLCRGLGDCRDQFFDRSRSWGVQLYRALLAV